MSAYPEGYGRCIVCGVGRDESCIRTFDFPEEHYYAGDPRPEPHAERGFIGAADEPPEGFICFADEPNHYGDQPHTAQCKPDCPLTRSPWPSVAAP